MGATTVTGTILGVDNAPQVGVYVKFRLKTTGTDSAATSTIDASTRSTDPTDSNGDFSITLWDNGDSGVTSVLEILMPSGQRHDVVIPAADATIDIWDLIENFTVGSADPQLPTNQASFLQVANNLSDVASAPTSRTNLGVAIGSDVQAHDAVLDATTASFLIADETKLDGVEALADVTDTTNVTAAGALMDSEVDADIKTLVLPASTTISAFGATLVDDASATAARTTLDVDASGTDNSTDVTLAGTPDYITISGQVITRNSINLTTDVTGDLPVADGGTGSSTAAGARANLDLEPGVDIATNAQGTLADSATQPSDNVNTLGSGAEVSGRIPTADGIGGISWSTAATGSGDLLSTNNLNDVANVSTSRTNMGLEIGVDVQAHAAVLDNTTAAFTTTDETKLDGIEALADVTDATNVVAAGAYVVGGTDVAVLDGGTGASTESGARTSLGLEIGVDVQAFDSTNLVDADIGSTVQAYDAILDTIETTITDTDLAIPTSGAVVDLIAVTAPTTSVVATTYTTLSADKYILANNAAGVTVTLLAAATAGDGAQLVIKRVGLAGAITIDGNASETIDGGLTATLTAQYESLTIVCDGSNWHII